MAKPQKSKQPFRFKSAHESYIPPEDITFATTYCLTINPKRNYETLKNAITRFKQFRKMMITILVPLNDFEYKFWIEQSSKGRYHIHGWLKFYSHEEILTFYSFLSALPHVATYKFGDLKSETDEKGKPIDGRKGWIKYCKKQIDLYAKLRLNPVLVPGDITEGFEENSKAKYDVLKYFDSTLKDPMPSKRRDKKKTKTYDNEDGMQVCFIHEDPLDDNHDCFVDEDSPVTI